MKSCELCKLAARTYCESDQASLCWNCDAKVHGANFLVARHVRCLLCHTCQSVTPWRAAGAKLGHTVSVCERCVNGGDREESEAENDDEDDDDDDDEEEEEVDSDDDVSVDDDVEEDGDNQVVPWSTVVITPPPSSSSSSSDDSSGGEREVSESTNLFSLKRLRENASDLLSQDDPDPSPSKRKYSYRTVWGTLCRPDDDAVSVDSVRLLKDQPIQPDGSLQFQADSSPRGAASTESLGKLGPDKIQ
ncbi:PREDICTED: zinc finger protein CONSTANS-LIKE 3 [Theobroma cacao]|uniref:Zinc finger protein CONSTANS-LIKE 3 n=2 Tax=Theobroma cacao TaxID=3641 RepID=A0AB32VIC3_THECC|nr:PREDICTED: zinc finger protein CONSTANS-LIKE 3 [Theobroma cacao]EOX99239.1 B-box type zinc finger family protein, putative [Theobroma cacao]